MSDVELKNKLKEKIENLNEEYLLEELLNIIELESNNSKVIIIPDEHKEKLDISLEQMEKGKVIPHDQVMKELESGLRS